MLSTESPHAVQVKDGRGRNSLHFAAQAGEGLMCHFLINELHYDVNVMDEEGEQLGLAVSSWDWLLAADSHRARQAGGNRLYSLCVAGPARR